MFRFSLKSLLIGVGVAAVALRGYAASNASSLTVVFTATFATLVVATLLARKPFWLGLSTAGWAYLVFTLGPFAAWTERWLPTTHLAMWLGSVHLRPLRYEPGAGPIAFHSLSFKSFSSGDIEVDLSIVEFRMLMLQCALALLSGCFAGFLTTWCVERPCPTDDHRERTGLMSRAYCGWLLAMLFAIAVPLAYWRGYTRTAAEERTQERALAADLLEWARIVHPSDMVIASYQPGRRGPNVVLNGGHLDEAAADELAGRYMDSLTFERTIIQPVAHQKLLENEDVSFRTDGQSRVYFPKDENDP